jgi:hypothetical protein
MRRTIVPFLSVVVVSGILLAGGDLFAAAQDTDYAGHPLVGSWMIDTDVENPEYLPAVGRFSADGGYVQMEWDGTSGLGAWEPTGDTTANLTFSYPEQDGVWTVRTSVDVAPDGMTSTGTFTLEFVDSSGVSSGQIGPGQAEATRMVVEGPGTPDLSFEEFYGQIDGTPEATPAP